MKQAGRVSILVIGYGNTLRSDDGSGWLAAESLLAAGQPECVGVIICQQLTLELAQGLAEVDYVLFLDARRGGQPGKIDIEPVIPKRGVPSLEHHVEAGLLLGATLAIYGRAPDALLLSMQANAFDVREGLSAEVAAAMPEFSAKAQGVINGWIEGGGRCLTSPA